MITFLLIFIISALPVPAAVARRGRPVPGRDVGLWELCPGACLEAPAALLTACEPARRPGAVPERVAVLLSVFGGQRRVELPKDDVETAPV